MRLGPLFVALVVLHVAWTLWSLVALHAFYNSGYTEPWSAGVWRLYVLIRVPHAPLLLLIPTSWLSLSIALPVAPLNSVLAVAAVWWIAKRNRAAA